MPEHLAAVHKVLPFDTECQVLLVCVSGVWHLVLDLMYNAAFLAGNMAMGQARMPVSPCFDEPLELISAELRSQDALRNSVAAN